MVGGEAASAFAIAGDATTTANAVLFLNFFNGFELSVYIFFIVIKFPW